MKMISVTDIEGFKLGNAENSEKGTGCTVIVCEEGAVGGVDVRGGGPATRETDLLRSENTVNAVNAVVLSGGSAFGLEAASGVMRELADMKIGFDVGDDIVVPIVCGAALYDLPVGDKAFPDIYMGAQAVRNAFAGSFAKGNHGAGTGATVGKLKGYDRAMKTGIGTFACGDGIVEVGAIAAVNAVGDIYNGAGNIIAGLRSEDGTAIYGTIKTLKNMVHDNVIQNDKSTAVTASTAFKNRSEIEEALAAAARQFKEEEAAAKNQVAEEPAEEPAEKTQETAEAPAAEFVFETPMEDSVEKQSEEIIEEPIEEIVDEPVEEIIDQPEEPVVTETSDIEHEIECDTEEEVSEEAAEYIVKPEAAEEQAEPSAEEIHEEFPEVHEEEDVSEIAEAESETGDILKEEPSEEFIPETPSVDIFEDNYREYAEISIPVATSEPVEDSVEEQPEEIIEEPTEEIFDEPAEEIIDQLEEPVVTETFDIESESECDTEEEVNEEAAEHIEEPEAAEEQAEPSDAEIHEELPDVHEEEAVPEITETEPETEDIPDTEPEEEIAGELSEETEECADEYEALAEAYVELAEAAEEQAELPDAEIHEELPDMHEEEAVPEITETEAEIIGEPAEEIEEPVTLTREEMGYDIVFNTTISCLITNAALTKSQANKLASILHDAYARAIKPVHGTMDGDTVFVLATGKQQVNFDAFAALATDVMQYAIIDGAMSAEGAYGLPAARDMQ